VIKAKIVFVAFCLCALLSSVSAIAGDDTLVGSSRAWDLGGIDNITVRVWVNEQLRCYDKHNSDEAPDCCFFVEGQTYTLRIFIPQPVKYYYTLQGSVKFRNVEVKHSSLALEGIKSYGNVKEYPLSKPGDYTTYFVPIVSNYSADPESYPVTSDIEIYFTAVSNTGSIVGTFNYVLSGANVACVEENTCGRPLRCVESDRSFRNFADQRSFRSPVCGCVSDSDCGEGRACDQRTKLCEDKGSVHASSLDSLLLFAVVGFLLLSAAVCCIVYLIVKKGRGA